MAKKFAGFKPETLQNKILPALGYSGPKDEKSINQFLASNPAAAAKMGKYTMVARQMVEGKPIQAQEGILADEDQAGITTTDAEGKRIRGGDITENILADPTAATTRAEVVGADLDIGQLDATDPGFQVGAGEDTTTTKGVAGEDLTAPEDITTREMEAETSEEAIRKAGEEFTGAKGEVSEEALRDAETVDPTKSAVLDLKTEEGTAAQVDAPDALEVGEGELLEGAAVDQSRIEEELAKEQAVTVSSELDRLMQDFEGGDTPAWAAGAMRRANAAMAARGLGASSMAGMAVVQAAMESALPIAKLDAANKQQMAMEKARQRANFLGIEFDQEFQAKVKNAARISEVANMNFTAEQTIALENARLTNTMDVANLNARSAKTVADTAALASLERQNLSEINKAAADNAQAFLDMDFKNLDNEQEAARTRFQETANAIINDTAQKNAAEQFNAREENDAAEFMASLATDVAKFNMDQHNAMERFNAGEENAMAQFNEEQKYVREKFNAENYRIIEQHNSAWIQSVTTDETAAINDAYREEAKVANDLAKTAYNNIIMEEKDLMYYAFTGSESKLDRNNKLAVANINSGSGGELEKGLADIATEVVTSYLTYKFTGGN